MLAPNNVNTDDYLELLTIIDVEADRFNRLVGQAVEMAQIEAQEVQMNFAPVDLREVVDEARESCSWVEATHPLSINVPELPKVLADKAMVAKVLCNLLEKAAKDSDPASPIFLVAEQRENCVTASVADRGVGIDPAEQSLVFERLYRSRAHNQKKSATGMGLEISRAIIESQEGRLTLTSQVNGASVFSFSQPIALS